MKKLDLFLFVLLGAIWGASFIFMRVAIPAFGPIPMMALRMILASLLIAAYIKAFSSFAGLRKHWKELFFLGAVNNGVPFIFIGYSVAGLNASNAAIINSTSPLFTAVVAAIWIREPFGPRSVVGLLLGIFGVATLMGWNPLPLTALTLTSAGFGLLSAICYGVAAVYARLHLRNLDAAQVAFGQFAWAAVILTPVALFTLPPALPSALPFAALLCLTVLGTVGAYLIFFHLLLGAGSVRTTTVIFVVPFFSILFGVLLLDEPLNVGMFVGLGLILLSVWLVLGERRS